MNDNDDDSHEFHVYEQSIFEYLHQDLLPINKNISRNCTEIRLALLEGLSNLNINRINDDLHNLIMMMKEPRLLIVHIGDNTVSKTDKPVDITFVCDFMKHEFKIIAKNFVRFNKSIVIMFQGFISKELL